MFWVYVHLEKSKTPFAKRTTQVNELLKMHTDYHRVF